ncbi:NEL-type E3 ubiquitin ligase domain-containing protein [Pseudomonas sp. 10-1B]|uniref:NEL-type E3 ubiquitin ligase domain-containing protein n=1 Tax=Pseudomonas sp. 10-1B TaxID=1546029 RepID=UPI0006A7E516|nr:NEL-type E3 ubiquitin ligase domain-containing protein [Pseudomonas sp. 10-1B]
MTQSTPPSLPPALARKLASATDDFIATQLPDWLQRASAAQVNALRDCFQAHRQSRAQVTAATAGLVSPRQFAAQRFTALLAAEIPPGLSLDDLEWLDVRRRFTVSPGGSLPEDELRYVRFPALLRLMQGLPAGNPFYEGSGLVRKGDKAVLFTSLADFTQRCHTEDVGKRYHDLLARLFTPAAQQALARHQRTAFALACELAALKGQLETVHLTALRRLLGNGGGNQEGGAQAYAGALHMLECPVAQSLKIQLRNAHGDSLGVVLYMPSDTEQPLRHFGSVSGLNDFLVAELLKPDGRERIRQLIALKDRPKFLATLGKRLLDDQPDLQLEGAVMHGAIFAELAASQIERVKDDARLQLVSSADADHRAAEARLNQWKEIGLAALGLAGLASPVVGMVLLGQLVVQTLDHVYEGAIDWHEGHQHEALEHMLGVAETVVVTAATVAGVSLVARGFPRSAFVDAMEPVSTGEEESRLWHRDLLAYESTPEDATLGDDGLYASDTRRWLRVGQRYYEVHRPEEHQAWRLRHSRRENAFEPRVEFNGERSWRLRLEQPRHWDDRADMLDRVWPQDPPLSPARAEQVLRVAGVDAEELRGVLVEMRPAPFNLRDTLLRFAADDRISRELDALGQSAGSIRDPSIRQWCAAHAETQGLGEDALGAWLLEESAHLQGNLLEHLSGPRPVMNPLATLVRRDFSGLPERYAVEAVRDVDPILAEVAQVEARVPLAVARKARALLRLARVNRALEGLFLRSAYTNGTGELIIALLRRLPGWPRSINLELREGADSGRLLTELDPQGAPEGRVVLVWRQGRFRLYDSHGREHATEVPEPAGIFQALVALLGPADLQRMGISGSEPAERLRSKLVEGLPAARKEILNLLGWRDDAPWFNPGKRLPDGRVGYPLGGNASRRETSISVLKSRIRALYPQLHDRDVDRYLERLLLQPGSPFESLLAQEHNYAQLESTLSRWTGGARSGARRQFAARLLSAWRYEGGNGLTNEMSLDLSGWHIGQLPELPAGSDFSHVTELVMAGAALEEFPTGFLHCFTSLRTLSLSNNRLTSIPAGVSQLTELRTLRLMSNRIRMNASGADTLSSLPNLRVLDLSHNPLRSLALRFQALPHLSILRLKRCRLSSVPRGLERSRLLTIVDLSDNDISTLPPELLQAPWSFRSRFNLLRNPLAHQEYTRLYVNDPYEAIRANEVDVATARSLWLAVGDPGQFTTRSALWNRLAGAPESLDLLQLLANLTQTTDFTHARAALTEQVWGVLSAVEQDADLRQAVFDRAREELGCHDSTAERFSRVQLQILVHQANLQGTTGQAGHALLALGRRLFRLEALERFAHQDALQRLASDPDTDVLEVILGYRVHLAHALDLPCQPRTMMFERLAEITPHLERAALEAVRGAEASGALAENIAERDFWRIHLKRRHAAAFAAIAEDFAARGSELDSLSTTLTSQDYTDRWQVLMTERQSAEHHLVLQLTREALEEGEPEAGQSAQSV